MAEPKIPEINPKELSVVSGDHSRALVSHLMGASSDEVRDVPYVVTMYAGQRAIK